MTTPSGYGTDYKLCYSGDIQTLFAMLRKNGFDEKSTEVSSLLNSMGMSIKCWKAPSGFYYALKYTKNVFQLMYSIESSTVSQQLPLCVDASTGIEATIQGRGLFRSIVLDRQGNILSYSPAKTLRCNDAEDLNAVNSLPASDFFTAFSHVEEFVEGTMINLFRVPAQLSNQAQDASTEPRDGLANQGWEISTKGVVGGDVFVPAPAYAIANANAVTGSPKEKTTFRKLFLDACIANKIDLSELDTRYSYSLVLQHPKNPMIAPIVEPRLFFIAAYTVDNATLTVTRHPRSVIDWKGAGFQVPRNCAVGTMEPIFSCIHMKYANPLGTTPYRVMGVVFHSGKNAGWSFKLRNSAYEIAKKTPMEYSTRAFYMYCSLRRSKEVKQHLALFPEDAASFSEFNERILAFVKLAYNSYIECFILKKHPLGEYPTAIRSILYRLHNEVYYPRKAAAIASASVPASTHPPVKVKLIFNDVLHYVNNLVAPSELFFSVNLAFPQTDRAQSS